MISPNKIQDLFEQLNQYVDNSGLREVTGLDTLAASKILSKLCRKSLLTMQGKAQYTRYVLADYAKELEAKQFNKPAELSDKPAELSDKPAELDDKSKNANEKIQYLIQQALTHLGKRPTEQEIKAVILLFCVDTFCSLGQLAIALKRNANYLRTAYLKTYLSEGYLIYQYPNNPTHPEQAYKTTEKGKDWLKQQGIPYDQQ